jgi:DNA-binding beta-propeller fold protein YncE
MKKRRILLALLCLLVGWGGAGMAHAAVKGVIFEATDNPGSWFECYANRSTLGCAGPAGLQVPDAGKSLAVIALGETISFRSGSQANTVHTAVNLIYPSSPAAAFDTDLAAHDTTLKVFKPTVAGLHVFFCDIHPYMFAAAIVVDTKINPAVFPLDLGKTLDLPRVLPNGGIKGLPTASDLALRLLHTFFIATNPNNWQTFPVNGSAPWAPLYPHVPVTAYDKDGNPVSIYLDAAMQGAPFNEPKSLSAPIPPAAPGVGQVWVDTQFEMMSGKAKPGTATAVDAATFKVERKVGLPHINGGQGMNNPHNMWTDRDQTVIYQTQWFDTKLAVFNRTSGQLVRNIEVGPAPAHVMTRTNNDQVHVSQNGGNNVRELDSLAAGNGFLKDIPMGVGDLDHAHPHAHWMSHNGSMMVTPNADTENSTLYNFNNGTSQYATVGNFPIATGMMPDSSKYYVANFLDSSISVITISGGIPTVTHTINLLANYNAITGAVVPDPSTGVTFVGALPIQTPVSPNGRFMVTANTLTATITVVDTATDTVVAMLPCDPGCHGVQFGAKKGGGYYAYVSSKFSNRMIVVDLAPQGGGLPALAGSVLLTTDNESSHFKSDGAVTQYAGMGGEGVLPIPLVYNGWVQNLPEEWKEKLTKEQKHPFPRHHE